MSISTPQAGGNRRPSGKSAAGAKPTAGARPTAGGKPAAGAKPAAKEAGGAETPAAKTPAARTPGARTGGRTTAPAIPTKGTRPGTGGGKGGRPPFTPVKVSRGTNWGPIALFSVVGLVAAGIIGFGVYEVHENGLSWDQKADKIPGIVDYRKSEPTLLKAAQHQYGKVSYPQSPPVGGPHNPNWQRCQGDVYDDQIPNENAVHALEHGSVWITYNPSLPKAQVDELAAKVRGNDFMLMSKYPGLDKPISLQAWGFQLKLDNANDKRIDDFIKDLRQNATQEPGAVCSSGNYTTKTGPDPVNLGQSTSASAAPSGSAPAAAPSAAATPSAAAS